MAKSRFEYVKAYEAPTTLLKNTWVVVRLDGRGFHRFTDEHKFCKPNDERALRLMNKCAESVLREFGDVVLAYGESDEFSFVLPPSCTLFNRRDAKIATTIASLFSSSYVFYWKEFMGDDAELLYPPVFDARCVCYPSLQTIRDYLSWRQADCHINNLYNTCFWALVDSGGMSATEAEEQLRGTVSEDKNELLFSRFGIKYGDLPAMFRRGSILLRERVAVPTEEDGAGGAGGAGAADEAEGAAKPAATAATGGDAEAHDGGGAPPAKRARKPPASKPKGRAAKRVISVVHEDLIGPAFWKKRPNLLGRQR